MVDCVTEIPLPGRSFAPTSSTTMARGTYVAMPTFVAGPENRLVAVTFDRLMRAANKRTPLSGDSAPTAPALVALFGPSGTGKTHLARGLVRYWQQQRGEQTASYTTATDFRRRFADAIAANSVGELRRELRGREVLVIDDLHQLPSGDYLTQELRATLDAYDEDGGAVVVTSTHAATSLANLPPDIRSRLAGGLLLQLAAPGAAARLSILRHASSALERPLSQTAAQRLAAGMSGHAPQLFAALFELAATPPANGADDLHQACWLLATRAARRPTLPQIIAAVAKHSRLPQKQLKSGSRKQSVVFARSIAVYLARELTDASYQQIGRALGGRDHATIIHNYRKIDRELKRDPHIQETIAGLGRTLVGR